MHNFQNFLGQPKRLQNTEDQRRVSQTLVRRRQRPSGHHFRRKLTSATIEAPQDPFRRIDGQPLVAWLTRVVSLSRRPLAQAVKAAADLRIQNKSTSQIADSAVSTPTNAKKPISACCMLSAADATHCPKPVVIAAALPKIQNGSTSPIAASEASTPTNARTPTSACYMPAAADANHCPKPVVTAAAELQLQNRSTSQIAASEASTPTNARTPTSACYMPAAADANHCPKPVVTAAAELQIQNRSTSPIAASDAAAQTTLHLPSSIEGEKKALAIQ